MQDDFVFTSESITAGHPDKLCDQVSDGIVDHFLQHDPSSSVVAECAVSSGVIFIAARYASTAKLDIPDIARQVIRGVGYPRSVFDADACTIMTSFIDQTSVDYRPLNFDEMSDRAIDRVSARQQATLFGYACAQTPALVPLPIWLAHRLSETLASSAVHKKLPYLLPDGQCQVGVEYKRGKPARIHSISLVASQTEEGAASPTQLRDDLIERVVAPVFKKEDIRPDDKTQIFVNPEGPLIGGGPTAHSGLTGRKTGVDTYGEYARHSGAALSGKDPMRIDRVGAYAARYAAKNVVAAGLAAECEVQLSYTIGTSRPVSVRVRTFGTGEMDDHDLTPLVRDVFDFRLGSIVRDLRLNKLPGDHPDGFYRRLAAYGQMGRLDLPVPWEQTDKIQALK